MRGRQSIHGLAIAALMLLLAACASDPAPRETTLSRADTTAPRAASKPDQRSVAVPMPPASRPQTGDAIVGSTSVGVASWYGERYHGRRTASGERFNMKAATAAHPSLPFGTRVRVTNLANGRSVVLRINDRGPFTKRRIIDVSRAAARTLGFMRAGITRVRVEIVALPG